MNYNKFLILFIIAGILSIVLTGCNITEFFDVFSPNVDTPPPSITATPTPIPTATFTPTPIPSCGGSTCGGTCPYSY